MQLEPLLIFLLARPFEPFELFLNDGRRIGISHPESASVYQGGLGLWVALPSGQMEFLEGDAVTSVRSTRSANPSDFIR